MIEKTHELKVCIFCDNPVDQNSIEHIVPESLGNKNYVLPNGAICRTCNNNFSKFEEKALTKTMLGFERVRMGIPTKKGNVATAKNGDVSWVGSKDFKKNIITTYGITKEMIESFNPVDGSYKIRIPDFDKSEMATSRLLLKMGFESLFTSQRKIFNDYNFKDLKEHLTNKNNKDWPFLTTTNLKLSRFVSLPRFNIKHSFNKINTQLLISEVDDNTLLFSFKYSVAYYMINLVNRDIGWTEDYLSKSSLTNLYPEHLKNKIQPNRVV